MRQTGSISGQQVPGALRQASEEAVAWAESMIAAVKVTRVRIPVLVFAENWLRDLMIALVVAVASRAQMIAWQDFATP